MEEEQKLQQNNPTAMPKLLFLHYRYEYRKINLLSQMLAENTTRKTIIKSREFDIFHFF
jgi:hypothetical protein